MSEVLSLVKDFEKTSKADRISLLQRVFKKEGTTSELKTWLESVKSNPVGLHRTLQSLFTTARDCLKFTQEVPFVSSTGLKSSQLIDNLINFADIRLEKN